MWSSPCTFALPDERNLCEKKEMIYSLDQRKLLFNW